jgi:hypothetical protein
MDAIEVNDGYVHVDLEVVMMNHAEEILENVVWLVTQCDDEALAKRRDLPFLELAKYVSRRHLPTNVRKGWGRCEQPSLSMKRKVIEL